jgi:hypothetical protein
MVEGWPNSSFMYCKPKSTHIKIKGAVNGFLLHNLSKKLKTKAKKNWLPCQMKPALTGSVLLFESGWLIETPN